MGKADIKIWQKKKTQDLPSLSNFLQRKAASSGEVLSLSASPPSALPFPRQWQGSRDSWPILLVDPPAGRSLSHLFLGPWLCPLHHLWRCSSSYRVSGSGWLLPLESCMEICMSSHTGHGESTLLPLPGRLLLPCALVQSVREWPYLGILMGILSYSALSLIPLWAQSPWGYLGF